MSASRATGWLSALKNGLIYWLVRITLSSLPQLSSRWLLALGRWCGTFAFYALPSSRRIAQENLRRIRPAAAPRELRKSAHENFRYLGELLGETVATLRDASPLAPLPVSPETNALLHDSVASKRGVIFASAHLGPWERVAATLVQLGLPFVALARQPYDPRLRFVFTRLRENKGVPTLYRGEPGATRRMVLSLRQGKLLGIPMDLRTRAASIEVPFLGAPASTAVGPARLALRTGAWVLVGTPAPGPSGLELTVTRIATDDLVASDDGERLLTARINEELSRRVAAFPRGWVWMHPRWEV